jgi:hypothetical protein
MLLDEHDICVGLLLTVGTTPLYTAPMLPSDTPQQQGAVMADINEVRRL